MTADHRSEAERCASKASYTNEYGRPYNPETTDFYLRLAMVHATLAAGQDPVREQLATLLDRWEEVANSCKSDAEDDIAERYRHYRHIYLRNIRDLRHLLQTGRIPCQLMTDAERATGECGHQHDAELEQHGTPEEAGR